MTLRKHLRSGVASSGAATSASVQDARTVKIARSGSQPSWQAPAENFTGSVEPLLQANAPARAFGARVTFEPGARTGWHAHPLGQTLIVTAGIGRVQRWGDPVEEIRQGDVVWTPPGQKHWHGASANTAMTHIAITEQLDGKTVEWMEKVGDPQYRAPVRAQGTASAAPASSASGDSTQPRPSQRSIGDFPPQVGRAY